MKLHLGAGLPSNHARWQEVDATATLAELHGASSGLRRERHVVEVDGRAFERARLELLAFRWFPPQFLAASVCSDGVTVVQRCRLGPMVRVDAPVRVVECVDEPHRVALAVVTLRGHPERGVERYELVLDGVLDRATLTVDKAWALADPLARLVAPFSTWLQGYATRRSLRHFRDIG